MTNVKYPNKFRTKEKYAQALVGHYATQYSELSLNEERWKLPITKVINCVSGGINDFDGYQWALQAIDYVKDAILPDLSHEEISLITSSYNDRTELYYFSTDKEEEVRILLIVP